VNNRKRVLVLTNTFPRWQGDNEPPFVYELCRRLSEEFDVAVLAPHTLGSMRHERMGSIEVFRFRYFVPRWEKLAYQGGILANLKRNRWRYLLLPLFFIAQRNALLRIMRIQRIDVIHAHWLIPQGLTAVTAGLLKKHMPPLLCTAHGGDLLGLNGWLSNLLKRWVIRRSSRLTVVSDTMMGRALLHGAEPEQLQTISMGIDTINVFTPDISARRATNQLLFVGRLVEKKGCTYLLDAMPEILRRYPDTRLSIVGSGSMEYELKQQADRLGIAEAVTFHGAVHNSELPVIYRRATVFMAPSIVTPQGDQEGFGLVLAEAMACGCPVLATDLPALRDVVIDGITGLVCRQKDSSDLVAKVCFLLDHPDLCEKLGRAGRQHVQEHFDWTVVSRRYATVYRQMLGPIQ